MPERTKKETKGVRPPEYSEYRHAAIEILDLLNDNIWSQEGFPASLRPNVNRIKRYLSVGNPVDDLKKVETHNLHPWLNKDIRDASDQAMANHAETGRRNFAAATIAGKGMVISPVLFAPPNRQALINTIAHEPGHDLVESPQRIIPTQYDDFYQQRIEQVLVAAFPDNSRPRLSQTWVDKRAYREVLKHKDWSITDLYFEDVIEKCEVFPLLFEMVTTQILDRQCNIAQFDSDLAAGKVVNNLVEHPRFGNIAISIMRQVGWRQLLLAASLSDESQFQASLEPSVGRIDSQKMFDGLVKAVVYDQNTINDMGLAFASARR